jgi:hypothetical protein
MLDFNNLNTDKRHITLYFIILATLHIPFFAYSQNIDISMYQEVSIREAHEIRLNNRGQTLYFKSIAHLSLAHWNDVMGRYQTGWSQDGNTVGGNYFSRDLLNRIQLSQIAIIYYRFEIDATGGFRTILDRFEVQEMHFIINTRYMATVNLRLRDSGSLSGIAILTIPERSIFTVLEEGNIETIDGLRSVWVRVRLNDGTEGWCFGGYLSDFNFLNL